MVARIADLEEQLRWRPVSEEPPYDGVVSVGCYAAEDAEYRREDGGFYATASWNGVSWDFAEVVTGNWRVYCWRPLGQLPPYPMEPTP